MGHEEKHKGQRGKLEAKDHQTEQPSLPVPSELEAKAELAVCREVRCLLAFRAQQVILRGVSSNGCSFSCMM